MIQMAELLVLRLLISLGLLAWLASPAAPWPFGDGSAAVADAGLSADTVAAVLRRRLAGPGVATLRSPELVSRFYTQRGYVPAWSRDASVSPRAEAMVGAIRGAAIEGLRPQDYRLEQIETILGHPGEALRGGPLDPGQGATLDLLLSDAFLTLGSHLAHGRIDPKRIHAGWSLPPRRVDVIAALERAIRDGRVEAALSGLAPPTPEYVALRAALQRYRGIAARGGWPALPPGPTLRPGDRSGSVALLRARLAAEVGLARAASPDVYDPALEAAVREFQRTHGLRDDTAVGPATRAALNVGAAERAEQIELSMERLRWLPEDLGRRHVRVSIPAFELAVVEEGRTALAMRIVGGRPGWRTPVFSARMTSVALSPYWNIPANIAREEIVPEARRDAGYLDRNEIRVVTGYGAAERTVDPRSIDWRRFDPASSAYRLRQEPGPQNPLGGVKFLFPNEYNVYLHDTPARHLFAEPVRAFSHGCMRVAKPLELAENVLGPLGWDRDEILAAMARGVERTVTLDDPIPVHILYQTAWVDTAGGVQFRDDLYSHDRRLAAALEGSISMASERASGECGLVPA